MTATEVIETNAKSAEITGGTSWPDRFVVRRICRTLCIVFAIAQMWALRYQMNPDGTVYVDIAKAYVRHDWSAALNSYWSPLYSWLIAMFLAVSHSGLAWEIPITHFIGAAGFLCSLAAWELLFREWEKWQGPPHCPVLMEITGYASLAWAGLWLIESYNSADIFVMAAMIFVAALQVRIRRGAGSTRDFVLIGLTLGAAFLAKAAMAVMIPVTLIVLVLMPGSARNRRIGLAGGVALMVCAPWIGALSISQGRLTLGDAGRINYAWCVDWFTYEGEKDVIAPNDDRSFESFRLLRNEPRVVSLTEHPAGTYPAHNSPQWWGRAYPARFAPLHELVVLRSGLINLLVTALSCPALWLALACVFARAVKPLRDQARRLWFVLAPAAAVTIGYWLVFVLSRYLAGAFALAAFSIIAAAWSIPLPDRIARYAARAIPLLLVAVMSVQIGVVAFFCIGGLLGKADPPNKQVVVLASAMRQQGLRPGARVGYIGQPLEATWLGLTGASIVEDIHATIHQDNQKFDRPLTYTFEDTDRFWRGSAEERAEVLNLFRSAGARWIFADNIPPWADLREWRPVGPGHMWRKDALPNVYFRVLD